MINGFKTTHQNLFCIYYQKLWLYPLKNGVVLQEVLQKDRLPTAIGSNHFRKKERR